MQSPRIVLTTLAILACTAPGLAQSEIGAAHLTPNLVSNVDRPLRYHPDRGDFVIENGGEYFNRPLYGGNTAFRVDGGDKPEFVLYLPGRGGNLRLGIRTGGQAKWLQQLARVETRYRPGELLYEIRDPLLGERGVLHVRAIAYAVTEGLGVRVEGEALPDGLELIWAYGGASGQRGKRDGDIGTEAVPISEWFQLRPEFCRGNEFVLSPNGFSLQAKMATIAGVVPAGSHLSVVAAAAWPDAAAALRESESGKPVQPMVTGQVALGSGLPLYLSLQRIGQDRVAGSGELDTYREVTAPKKNVARNAAPPAKLLPVFTAAELPSRFAEAEAHFEALRKRVSVDTPDPFLNAAVGALNVAADAVWDEPQHGIMHGAIAWRTRLLGWRGPYLLDALGWHERFRENAEYWLGRQNTDPVPARIPPADEKANLARNEAGLHTNGDLSNSHYDMNLVFIDALFRHLEWTGDLAFAREAWPVIERHLAWERRLFRREFGPAKLPLYEAYAAIWASDDLQYSGGGAMHASAYNYYENRQAARVARLIGVDPQPYDHEADLLARSMRELLWVTPAVAARQTGGVVAAPPGGGWFAEGKDWLGEQRVHPDAALWTFYHTMDSEVPTPQEAWQMAGYVETHIPHLPVRGPGVPAGLFTLSESDWMPYDWSINNVVMAEAVHGALGYWQAGRADEAFAITEGSLLAAMFMGISPGNVGSMSYLDVYRRESQRDFADGGGVLSRALVEGLFGVKPDALAGALRVAPGWPAAWKHARIRHPDFSLEYVADGDVDHYVVEQHRSGGAAPLDLRLQLVARRDAVAAVLINGQAASWQPVPESIGAPRITITAPAAVRYDVRVRWSGGPVKPLQALFDTDRFKRVRQGSMTWLNPVAVAAEVGVNASAPTGLEPMPGEAASFEPVRLATAFNDSVTRIFKNAYRSPRSPFVSLALPKQGIGGWAGGVNKTATIDDAGLRAAAAAHDGRIELPNGVPFVTPAAPAALNVVFVSQWDNYPRSATVALTGRARAVYLLLAGSTNPMQSRFENGAVVVSYSDGSRTRLPLVNPLNWWPIEQDYFIDDFQFRRPQALPTRLDLKTGRVRELSMPAFKGHGGAIAGGAATVLALPLDPAKTLTSLSIEATANDVVIGLMAATLAR